MHIKRIYTQTHTTSFFLPSAFLSQLTLSSPFIPHSPCPSLFAYLLLQDTSSPLWSSIVDWVCLARAVLDEVRCHSIFCLLCFTFHITIARAVLDEVRCHSIFCLLCFTFHITIARAVLDEVRCHSIFCLLCFTFYILHLHIATIKLHVVRNTNAHCYNIVRPLGVERTTKSSVQSCYIAMGPKMADKADPSHELSVTMGAGLTQRL